MSQAGDIEKRRVDPIMLLAIIEARDAAVSALRAKLAEVEKARDNLAAVLNAKPTGSAAQRERQLTKRVETAEAARTAAEAEVAGLKEALEPFAKEADEWPGYDDIEPLVEGWNGGPSSQLKVFHLRRARAALTKGRADD
jgi:hypothetical protein